MMKTMKTMKTMKKTTTIHAPLRLLRALAALAVLAVAGGAAAGPTDDPRPDGEPTAPAATPAPDGGAAPTPAPVEDPLADVKAVAAAAFKSCLDDSESRAFGRYLDLIHPEQKDGDKAVIQIQRYSWAKFRGGCKQWLKDPSRLEFVVARSDPARVDAATERVKLFFKAQHKPAGGGPLRWDAPMEFQKYGDRWMIWRNSL
jgi:hypothetical protein